MNRLVVHQVDAFASSAFAGNPAAVCLLERAAEPAWMQAVAREMNLSETAFLTRRPPAGCEPRGASPDSGPAFDLRWFTPTVEVDLCGHATLASAHVLWETGIQPPDAPARFATRSGWLTAIKDAPEKGWIELEFQAQEETRIPVPRDLEAALGVPLVYAGASRADLLAEVPSEDLVRGLVPDLAALRRLNARGVMVTARAHSPSGTRSQGFDFVSRFFAPSVGVDEDPVTGSAHCTLGPYWGKKLGKAEMVGYQASARGGVVRVRLQDDRVFLGGQAVTVMRGELLVPLNESSGRDV